LNRLFQRPVHKFYKATNNQYLWGISANQVLFSNDASSWFTAQGLNGIKFIRDIVEDSFGNMYVSTDRGVYWLETASLRNFGRFQQTVPINAFTNDCYGLFHNHIPSGLGEIWVSTEVGLYKTTNYGRTWELSGLSTQNLITFQFIEISSQIIIAITRKHILRKTSIDDNFKIICNFEDSFGVFDIWKCEFCNNRLYISTGSGVFVNTDDNLTVLDNITTSFERTFFDIDFNSSIGIAFGIDRIDFGDLGERLFIGQENRLFAADENNVVTLKTEYLNKELPEFFINNREIETGFVYNVFNNVLCFREPIDTNETVSAAYLPRTTFISQNGGWAQTNCSADIFIYKNGLITWTDWKTDNNDILSEIQIIESNLNTLPPLTTFNSLYPKSQTYLDATHAAIDQIKTGGQNNTPNITSDTIAVFLNNYTIFLSLLTKATKLNANLTYPEIQVTGSRPTDRLPNSRAELSEEQLDFTAEEATSINIDTFSGTVDFTTAATETTDITRKQLLTFNKYDQLQISIFNTNLKNTGALTHTDIEDNFESINTGLSSNLERVAVSNLIKSGIYIEKQHNNIFSTYNVSNIQSKFFASYTNSWYDLLNSTVDYNTVIQTEDSQQSRFVNSIICLSSDEYGTQPIWAATDAGIIEYFLNNSLILTLNNLIIPDGESLLNIKDLYLNNNSIYAIVQNDDTLQNSLYITNNNGILWTKIGTINLPSMFNRITILNGNIIAVSESGVFYSDNSFGEWYESELIFPTGVSTNTDATNNFRSNILNIYSNNFIIVEKNKYFYVSGNGVEFVYSGNFVSEFVSVVNKIYRFKNITYIGTDAGLYSDGNSILSNNVAFDVISDIADDIDAALVLHINDITSINDALYCCDSNGNLYRFFDNNVNDETDNVWQKYKIPDFECVHKISGMIFDNKHLIVATCFEKITVLDVTPNAGIFN